MIAQQRRLSVGYSSGSRLRGSGSGSRVSTPSKTRRSRQKENQKSHLSPHRFDNSPRGSGRVSRKTKHHLQSTLVSKEVSPMFKEEELLLDIDYADIEIENVFAHGEYVKEIYNHLRTIERPISNPNYLAKQPILSSSSRRSVIDWLAEVHTSFRLPEPALFLCIRLLDTYLSRFKIKHKQVLQEIGISSLYLASKAESQYTQAIDFFVRATQDKVPAERIRSTELTIWKAAGYNMNIPTVHSFLTRFEKVASFSMRERMLCHCIAELSLYDAGLLPYPPSKIAAAVVLHTRSLLRETPLWSRHLAHYSGYSREEVGGVLKQLRAGLDRLRPMRDNAVKEKYQGPSRLSVALHLM